MARRVRDARCSFCGKNRDQVRKLVAGPGVFICDRCIDLCNEVLKEELPKAPEATERGTSAVSPRSRIVSRRTGLWGWLDRFFSARAAQPV